MSIKSKLLSACAGVVVAGGLASVANADLVIDLRIRDWQSTPGATSAKTLERPLVAQESVVIDIYAIVSGKLVGIDRTPKMAGKPAVQIGWNYVSDYRDGIQSFSGSVKTHNIGAGAAVGDNVSGVWANGHEGKVSSMGGWASGDSTSGANSADGSGQDLNGDNLLDLGAPDGTPTTQAGKYINIKAAAMAYEPSNPTINAISSFSPVYTAPPDTPSKEYWIGSVSFWSEQPIPGGIGQTEVNWALRRLADGSLEANAALWEEDRLLPNSVPAGKEQDPMNGVVGNIRVGAPVVIGVIPEPMSLSVFGLGAALLGFRRRR